MCCVIHNLDLSGVKLKTFLSIQVIIESFNYFTVEVRAKNILWLNVICVKNFLNSNFSSNFVTPGKKKNELF